MGSGIFVTGTDTGVGKTRFCSLLLRSLRSQKIDAVGIKPFCCGDRLDAEELYAASGESISLAEVNPVWLRVPAAPYAACLIENRTLDVAMAIETIRALAVTRGFLVIEGVGGWRVPLTQELCISQFARELGFPVVVVSANRLGALNHTQLTVDSICSSQTPCLGVVLNQADSASETPATVTNRAVLEGLLQVPILGEIDHGAAELPPSIRDKILAGMPA